MCISNAGNLRRVNDVYGQTWSCPSQGPHQSMLDCRQSRLIEALISGTNTCQSFLLRAAPASRTGGTFPVSLPSAPSARNRNLGFYPKRPSLELVCSRAATTVALLWSRGSSVPRSRHANIRHCDRSGSVGIWHDHTTCATPLKDHVLSQRRED